MGCECLLHAGYAELFADAAASNRGKQCNCIIMDYILILYVLMFRKQTGWKHGD